MASQPNEPDHIYQPGLEIHITSHRPPLPFGPGQDRRNAPKIEDLGPAPTETDDHLDYVFAVHPSKTRPVSNPREATITVEKQLPSEKPYGAQVLVCTLKAEFTNSHCVVAKIYDPLYYELRQLDHPKRFFRVAMYADRDYSREAAAYERVSELHQHGILTPKYYGSWTFTLRSPCGKSRPVRLILIEFIDGPTVHQAYYETHRRSRHTRHWGSLLPNEEPEVPDAVRMDIMANLLMITTAQRHIGLYQRDCAPRNVIAIMDDHYGTDHSKHRVKRVVLIDYNVSVVKKPDPPDTKAENPLESLWKCGVNLPEWEGWVPLSWDENFDKHRTWLLETFGSASMLEQYRIIDPEVWQDIQTWAKANKSHHEEN